jgi:NlpC/P60 family putative phage cell wall peptidase
MVKACLKVLVMSERIEQIARDWIGTPYVHQHSSKGVGTDCLGLLRGMWRESIGSEPEVAPIYTADWSEASGDERLWAAAQKHLFAVPLNFSQRGNVVLFRVFRSAVAKHLAVLGSVNGEVPTIIHAYSGKGVVETPLTPAWKKRIVAQFRFPNGEK